MVRLSGQRGVPVTVIDGEAVVGYDRPRLQQLLTSAHRPRLGAAVADAALMAAKGRCAVTSGAYVGRVGPGTPASRAGLRSGDVITHLANQPVGTAQELERLMAGVRPGQSVSLTYVREGSQHNALLRF